MTEWTLETWQAHIDELTRKHRERSELMRGRKYLSTEELELIHSHRHSIDEKRARLIAIRDTRAKLSARRKSSGKTDGTGRAPATATLTFQQRLNDADALRARAWGISLV